LILDRTNNTVTILDPYGAYGETYELQIKDLLDVEIETSVLDEVVTDDYQNRNGNYPRAGIPDLIEINGGYLQFEFKNTSIKIAEAWVTSFLRKLRFTFDEKDVEGYQTGDYEDDWVDVNIKIADLHYRTDIERK
jgi:hypothetical protein